MERNTTKLVCGVGYQTKGQYSKKNAPKIYTVWSAMLYRCYGKNARIMYPTWSGFTVCDEWLCFQNFALWFVDNYVEGFHLDKDWKVLGSKVYSPETCCFIPAEINTCKGDLSKSKGYTIVNGRYAVMGMSDKAHHLGTYKTEEEARQVFVNFKRDVIRQKAEKWKSQIPKEVYNNLINI